MGNKIEYRPVEDWIKPTLREYAHKQTKLKKGYVSMTSIITEALEEYFKKRGIEKEE